ncbi:MAG: DUF3524 domain-containing protein [Candidatus Latescibacteria bacterium]|nr:DUF3524 domain-containing protein [bacterium]MBD3423933.1 DUF3524 domain-containing protein [Candidatus Latescibacterota bacterium]
MDVLIVEPFFTGSHARWAEGYAAASSHDISLLTLPGRHWKWRMHGGAVALAGMFRNEGYKPDLILATDMLDLTTFLSLIGDKGSVTPTAVYFHENQLSYPWPEEDPDIKEGRDAHYGFINYSSALAAGTVLFNSSYHLSSFLSHLEPFLAGFPDYKLTGTVSVIRNKSGVLNLGLDLRGLDRCRDKPEPGSSPLILWNHRWEYDKNPEEFFRALFILAEEGRDFRVAVLGESFNNLPPVFDEARERLVGRLVHFGYVPDRRKYAAWLRRADILPVTSRHDFFGAGVAEAIYCDCCPVLPDRLAYPEHIPESRRKEFLYSGFDGLLTMMRGRIDRIEETRKIITSDFVAHYDWKRIAPVYDKVLAGAAAGKQPGDDRGI